MQTLPKNPQAEALLHLKAFVALASCSTPEALAPVAGISDAPSDAEFRKWLSDSMAQLGLSTRAAARLADLSPNAIGLYLRDPDRSIYLSSAHKIMCKMRQIASEKGEALPLLGGGNG